MIDYLKRSETFRAEHAEKLPAVFLPMMVGGERWERQAAEYRARIEERQETTDGS